MGEVTVANGIRTRRHQTGIKYRHHPRSGASGSVDRCPGPATRPLRAPRRPQSRYRQIPPPSPRAQPERARRVGERDAVDDHTQEHEGPGTSTPWNSDIVPTRTLDSSAANASTSRATGSPRRWTWDTPSMTGRDGFLGHRIDRPPRGQQDHRATTGCGHQLTDPVDDRRIGTSPPGAGQIRGDVQDRLAGVVEGRSDVDAAPLTVSEAQITGRTAELTTQRQGGAGEHRAVPTGQVFPT